MLREIIAKKLDKNPDYCWANLTMWMLKYRGFWSILPWSKDNDYKEQMCRKNKRTPYSYCGKCEITGKFWEV